MRRLLDVDLRLLRIFRAVAEHQGLAGAELVLGLSPTRVSAGLAELEAVAEPAALRGEQLWLFAHDRARDRGAASRAMARVRAAFGERSVTRARLREAHLPEARFAWEPVAAAPPAPKRAPPATSREGESPLVRRLYVPPREIAPERLRALSPMPPGDALPWLRAMAANDPAHGGDAGAWPLATPSRVTGAWWAREVARDYYYAEGADGALLWVYYDGVRRRWFVHAEVD